MKYYNRYSKLIENGLTKQMPYIKIRNRPTDKSHTWNKDIDRMDLISNRYYQSSNFDWLIKMVNAKYGDEYDIPDSAYIRIPYPLEPILQEFVDEMNKYDAKFGI